MNTLGICTILFGGWVLPSVTPPIDQPSSVIDPRVAAAADFAAMRKPSPTSAGQSRSVRSAGSRQMPMAPTDPSAQRSSPTGPRWSSATANTKPGSRRATFQRRSSYLSQRGAATGASGVRPPAMRNPALAGTKPFSSYRTTTGVSPYLNLFRTNGFDGIDNYNTLVRPMVEQSYLNRRVSGQLQGLQSSRVRQDSSIRRIGEATSTLQGHGTPQFYQNSKGYFPGQPR